MYINFEKLMASGLSPSEFLSLVAIRQKEEIIIQAIPEDTYSKLNSLGFTEKLKSGAVRISKKGSSFIEVVETGGLTADINETFNRCVSLYKEWGKEIGVSQKEAQRRLIWFMSNTNFRGEVVVSAVESHLENSGEYTMSLCNLIWKPQSIAFSVHMGLKDSKLFDIIANKFGFNTEPYFASKQSVEMEWLFAVSRLPKVPSKATSDMLFTLSPESEKKRLIEIKKYLLTKIKKYVK